MASGVVHVPWYATVLRGDKLAAALSEISKVSLQYNATKYAVHRSRDDAYKLLQMIWFEDKADWIRYWDGPDMQRFRALHQGWFQVPVLYVWHDEVVTDSVEHDRASNGNGNGVPFAVRAS